MGLPMESDFSIYLCIFGILRDYSLGYLMYLSLCPAVFLTLCAVLACAAFPWR